MFMYGRKRAARKCLLDSLLDTGRAALGLCLAATSAWAVAADQKCPPPDQWYSPASGEIIDKMDVLAGAAEKRVVLLGEHHGNALHHLWQKNILSALQHSASKLIIALEMLPREEQPTVEAFYGGRIALDQFVRDSGWEDYWAYPVEIYAPVLEFIRDQGVPTHAVNISRDWLDAVSQRGLDAVLAGASPPFQQPAAPPREYLLTLARSFRSHRPPDSDTPFTEDEGWRFKRFVDVQLAWDKALADGVKKLVTDFPQATVVLLAGTWHVVNRHGVVHQLADMGVSDVAVLVPWDEHIGCDELNPAFADAVFYPTR